MGLRVEGLLLCWLFLVGCASSSETMGPVGVHTASIDPAPGIHRPVDPDDPKAVGDRRRLLGQLEAAIALMPVELRRASAKGSAWPVADVDPGGRSGQVVLYRPVAQRERRGPVAVRWRRVSLFFDPPRILEVSPLEGAPTHRSGEDLRLRAIAAALEIAAMKKLGPSHTHALFEQKPGGAGQIRVYVFGDGSDQPVLDIVFELEKRRPWVRPVTVSAVHPVGERTEAWILTPREGLSPSTVARVLALGTEFPVPWVPTTPGESPLSNATVQLPQFARWLR